MSQDSQLQQAVLMELGWEPSVTAAHIGVTANAGVVTLTGHVESFAEKHAAEAAARRVRGVSAVAQDIEVRLPFERRRGDDDIAAAVLDRLAWDVSVPAGAVTVQAENGWVTLGGHVDWHFQKEAAEQDVRSLVGVTGVSNQVQVQVRPHADASHIKGDILHALHRSWLYDPADIVVSAEGSKVRLTGTVHTPHERQVAGATAWAAPGAAYVENDLAIL